MRFPILLFVLSFMGLWLFVRIGIAFSNRISSLDKETREDFSVVQTATLTLLGIIIGFSFSMAVGRYDQRKNFEEDETNAIGTEYLRLDLLPPGDAAASKELLRKYLDQRIAFYEAQTWNRVERIKRDTEQVETQLWSAVRKGATGQQAAVVTLTVAGLNNALDARGYTEAAWLNRIPAAAWIMMEAVAIFGTLLIGMGAHKATAFVSLGLPFVISVAFLLIADLDSPRKGLIRVHPENLIGLSQSLNTR